MGRRIIVYGNGDTTPKGFPTEEHFRQWIGGDVFTKYRARYHYTQGKDVDVIVLSRKGLAHGHFEIEDRVVPDQKDQQDYPPVKFTYLVRRSVLYRKPVRLFADLGIRVRQGGVHIEGSKLKEIMKMGR